MHAECKMCQILFPYNLVLKRVHTWCALECASSGSESEAHWMRIDHVHTGFWNSRAMRIVRANGYATILRVTKWPTLTLAVLAVLLLFTCARLCLKHERDRRRLRSTRPTHRVEFAPACHALTLRNLSDNWPRNQLAKPDRRPMRMETNAHHVWTCGSGLNVHSMHITALVWAGL